MINEYSKQYWIDNAYEDVEVEQWHCDWNEETESYDEYTTKSIEHQLKNNCDERSFNSLCLQGREWRKYICKHWLANDLLDKLEDASDPTALMAFVDILTLLNYGMAQTAYNLLSATAVPSELDELKTWLLDALNTIAQD